LFFPQHFLPAAHPPVKIALMTRVSIALNTEDQRFIEEAVKSGRYFSESEVIAQALSEMKVREAIRRSKIDDLRAKVQVGIEQADRGEFVEFTAEDVKAEGRRRLAAR
jgi:antitoxin ParD1/3/4